MPPFTNFPISVRQEGDLAIAYMHGTMQDDCFTLYLGLEHYARFAHAEVWCEGGCSIVLISVTENTHWYEDRDGVEVRCTPTSDLPTAIEFPPGWCLGVDAQKDVIRIIGVRMIDDLDELGQEIPFTVEQI